jgi:RimJ/RimL family protein N-acetyltransferase
MRLRRVSLDKWRDELVELHKQTFPFDSEPRWEDADWWIAYDGDKPIGFCGGQRWPDQCYYLVRAGVLASHRGRGLQRRMVLVRIRRAANLGCRAVWTYCTADNLRSANVLKRYFKLACPQRRWGGKSCLYWHRKL